MYVATIFQFYSNFLFQLFESFDILIRKFFDSLCRIFCFVSLEWIILISHDHADRKNLSYFWSLLPCMYSLKFSFYFSKTRIYSKFKTENQAKRKSTNLSYFNVCRCSLSKDTFCRHLICGVLQICVHFQHTYLKCIFLYMSSYDKAYILYSHIDHM